MDTKLVILEGLDGTGKTTVASYIIQKFSTGDFPIHYIYFQKQSTVDLTYDYFLDLYEVIKTLKGVVIMDRSIISTYAYDLVSTADQLRRFEIFREFDPLVLFFKKVYDQSKLPNKDQVNLILSRYDRALNVLLYFFMIPTIYTTAELFIKKIQTLKDFKYLIEHNALP